MRIGDRPVRARLVQTKAVGEANYIRGRGISSWVRSTDHLNSSFYHQRTLLYLSLPRRNAKLIDRHSGVPRLCTALELTPPLRRLRHIVEASAYAVRTSGEPRCNSNMVADGKRGLESDGEERRSGPPEKT